MVVGPGEGALFMTASLLAGQCLTMPVRIRSGLATAVRDVIDPLSGVPGAGRQRHRRVCVMVVARLRRDVHREFLTDSRKPGFLDLWIPNGYSDRTACG